MAISDLELPTGVVARSDASAEAHADALAQRVADALRQAIDSRGSATLVVSGGRSPVAFLAPWRSRPWTGARCW